MVYNEVELLKLTAFKRSCGVKSHTFTAMVKALQAREAQKKKPGLTADLQRFANGCSGKQQRGGEWNADDADDAD